MHISSNFLSVIFLEEKREEIHKEVEEKWKKAVDREKELYLKHKFGYNLQKCKSVSPMKHKQQKHAIASPSDLHNKGQNQKMKENPVGINESEILKASPNTRSKEGFKRNENKHIADTKCVASENRNYEIKEPIQSRNLVYKTKETSKSVNRFSKSPKINEINENPWLLRNQNDSPLKHSCNLVNKNYIQNMSQSNQPQQYKRNIISQINMGKNRNNELDKKNINSATAAAVSISTNEIQNESSILKNFNQLNFNHNSPNVHKRYNSPQPRDSQQKERVDESSLKNIYECNNLIHKLILVIKYLEKEKKENKARGINLNTNVENLDVNTLIKELLRVELHKLNQKLKKEQTIPEEESEPSLTTSKFVQNLMN
jgi:hypothetical protein